jgi:hypothetical protein
MTSPVREVQVNTLIETIINKVAPRKVRTRNGYKNGNRWKVITEPYVLLAANDRFEVPGGLEICVYGPMGGSGTAAVIEDPVNGNLTIMKNGTARRQPSTQLPLTVSVSRHLAEPAWVS